MDLDCDVVVVGGGIAGLTCALRLAAGGASVVLIDRGRLGSGATLSNPGVVHSGALYAELHPHVARLCGEATAAFRASLPVAALDLGPSRYVAQPWRTARFRRLWSRLGIPYGEPGADRWPADFRDEARTRVEVSLIQDLVLDTRRALLDLTARCLAASVAIVVDYPVRRLVRRGSVVTGVCGGLGPEIRARDTVVACGSGAAELLGTVGSAIAGSLRSRLSTMGALPSAVAAPVMGLDYGGLCLVPGTTGHALITRYGVPVRWMHGRLTAATSAAELRTLQESVSFLLRSGEADPGRAWVWPAAKTEVAQGTADAWGVEPAFATVDHRSAEGMPGLWTVIPGKMTLALHASQALATALTGSPHDLTLPCASADAAALSTEAGALVEQHPWQQPAASA